VFCVIVSLHVATGGAAGAIAGSRLGAVVLGPVMHALGDLTPHRDIPSTAFEATSGIAGVVLLARRYGALHPVTIGAVAASIPDVEHVLRPPRRGRRMVFPTHRFKSWHLRGGLPAWVQLAAAAAILGVLLTRPRADSEFEI
jgi:hypothetical protein